MRAIVVVAAATMAVAWFVRGWREWGRRDGAVSVELRGDEGVL